MTANVEGVLAAGNPADDAGSDSAAVAGLESDVSTSARVRSNSRGDLRAGGTLGVGASRDSERLGVIANPSTTCRSVIFTPLPVIWVFDTAGS
jgi:hypothetical protein